jgi:hypothetical protein
MYWRLDARTIVKNKKTPSFTLDNWRLRDERFKLLPGTDAPLVSFTLMARMLISKWSKKDLLKFIKESLLLKYYGICKVKIINR